MRRMPDATSVSKTTRLTPEPPVPAGLGELSASLRSLVDLLSDLRDLAGRDGDPVAFARRVRELRTRYAGRPGLLQRLDRAGLPGR